VTRRFENAGSVVLSADRGAVARGARITAASLVVAFLALSTSGCTQASGERTDSRTPHESKQRLVQLIHRTDKALDVASWKLIDDGSEENCTVDGGAGVRYTWAQRSGPSNDTTHALTAVRALWEREGVHVTAFASGGSTRVHGLHGAGGPVGGLEFIADPRGFGLSATSACAEK
jgi:hypothetical protein